MLWGRPLLPWQRHLAYRRGDLIAYRLVRMFVCQFVCQHDNSAVRDIITKFSGHHPMVERADKFDNGYIGVRGWWFNVSDVLVYRK